MLIHVHLRRVQDMRAPAVRQVDDATDCEAARALVRERPVQRELSRARTGTAPRASLGFRYRLIGTPDYLRMMSELDSRTSPLRKKTA